MDASEEKVSSNIFLLQLFLRHMIDQWLLVNSRKMSEFQNLERECGIDSNKVEGKKYQSKKMTLTKYKTK